MPRLFVATLFLFACGYPSNTEACSCGRQGAPCAAVWSSDVVFVGRAETGGPGNRVRFTVERAVRGLDAAEIDVVTGPGNCSYQFEAGERYVVYARRNPQTNEITTSICTRTRPAMHAADDLAYFDEILRPATGARVYGRIRHVDIDFSTGRPVDYGPIANVALTLTTGATTFSTTTGRNGQFEFAPLQPGTYEFRANLATMFVPWRSSVVTLANDRTCKELDSIVRLNGRIGGRVLGEDGKPAAGVRIEALTPHAAGGNGPPHTAGAVSNQDGSFEIGPLPAGDYLVGTELSMRLLPRKLDRRRFYPGVRDRAAAQMVHLNAGALVHLQDFRLPPLPTERIIQIVVLDSDGALVPGATITLYGARPEEHVAPEGKLTLTLPYGAQFNVAARVRMTVNGNVTVTRSTRGYMTVDRDDGDGTVELRLIVP